MMFFASSSSCLAPWHVPAYLIAPFNGAFALSCQVLQCHILGLRREFGSVPNSTEFQRSVPGGCMKVDG